MNILIVDDNEIDLETGAHLIEAAGHTPIKCNSANTALSFFESDSNATPNLIITDWNMPDMNGSELCQRLRGLPFSVSPYIILTTADSIEDAEVNALESGADDFIEKPMTLRSLKARIRVAERIISAQLNLKNLALTDGLTGLLNRRAGMTAIQSQLARMQRNDTVHGCMIMCDIDYFKRINDTYGHTAGDIVLKEVSSRLAQSLRAFDTVCRYGGEEFLIFCEADEVDIQTILDRVMETITKEPVLLDTDDSLPVTLSMGCYINNTTQQLSMSERIKKADALLYQAKEAGRNRYITNIEGKITGSA